jgi:hypothetical protein
MRAVAPIIIGGNGHSGTRIFNRIVTLGGVFTGVTYLTRRANSDDLRMFDLMDRWAGPFVYGSLAEGEKEEMKRAFARRLRLYFPFRGSPWGFKEPRTLLILPVLHEMFPDMKFVHVIRDGRDIALGNPFVHGNRYVDAFLSDDERALSPEEKMVLFWGRGNQRTMEYGIRALGDRYAFMRWEDLCTRPLEHALELLRFASCPESAVTKILPLISKPGSMGRWKTFPADIRDRVERLGAPWLRDFGYA